MSFSHSKQSGLLSHKLIKKKKHVVKGKKTKQFSQFVSNDESPFAEFLSNKEISVHKKHQGKFLKKSKESDLFNRKSEEETGKNSKKRKKKLSENVMVISEKDINKKSKNETTPKIKNKSFKEDSYVKYKKNNNNLIEKESEEIESYQNFHKGQNIEKKQQKIALKKLKRKNKKKSLKSILSNEETDEMSNVEKPSKKRKKFSDSENIDNTTECNKIFSKKKKQKLYSDSNNNLPVKSTEINIDKNRKVKKLFKKFFFSEKNLPTLKRNEPAAEYANVAYLNKSNKETKLQKKQKMKITDILGFSVSPELTSFLKLDESRNDKTKTDLSKEEENKSNFISLKDVKIDELYNRKNDAKKMERTLFVGNLPLNTDKKVLLNIFRPFGKVESVRIRSSVAIKPTIPKKIANIKQKYSKEMKSLKGYVVFEDADDAQGALILNGRVVNGNHLRVDKASSLSDTEHTVFLGNLPFQVEDEILWNMFSLCGAVKNVRVIRDKATGEGKGFGFISFKEKDSVERAIKLNGLEIEGRKVRVKQYEKNSSPKKEKPGEVKPKKKKQKRDNESPKKEQKKDEESQKNKKVQKRRRFKPKIDEASNSRKTFKKINLKRKRLQAKKKITSLFNN